MLWQVGRLLWHEAQHTAGAPAEVRVEHVGIVPIGSLHTGWALKVDGIIRRSSKRYRGLTPWTTAGSGRQPRGETGEFCTRGDSRPTREGQSRPV
jgi:hypothetical protein